MGNPPCWQVQISVQRPSTIEVRANLDGAPFAGCPTNMGSASAVLKVLEAWFGRTPEAVFEVAVQSAAGAEVRLTASRSVALTFAAQSLERALTRARGMAGESRRAPSAAPRMRDGATSAPSAAPRMRDGAARERFADHEE